jgi:hypothetical protein
MNGHVFQCPNEGGEKNEFTKTIEALHEYIAKKITYPGDMWNLTTDMTEPVVPEPPQISDEDLKSDGLKKAVWTKQVSNYVVRCEQLQQNMRAVSSVILGQCSDAMKAKLKANSSYKEKYGKADAVWLLTTIRSTMLKFEEHQNVHLGLRDALAAICNHRQGDNDLTTYRTELESLVEAYESYGGEFGRSEELMKLEASRFTTEEKSTRAHNRAVAIQFASIRCGQTFVRRPMDHPTEQLLPRIEAVSERFDESLHNAVKLRSPTKHRTSTTEEQHDQHTKHQHNGSSIHCFSDVRTPTLRVSRATARVITQVFAQPPRARQRCTLRWRTRSRSTTVMRRVMTKTTHSMAARFQRQTMTTAFRTHGFFSTASQPSPFFATRSSCAIFDRARPSS